MEEYIGKHHEPKQHIPESDSDQDEPGTKQDKPDSKQDEPEVPKQILIQQPQEKKSQILPQIAKIKYPKCNKGNFHEGELLNYVCLSTTNKDDLLGCSVCQEENRKAQWRPLKVILHSALENSLKQAKNEFNCDEIESYLEEQKQKAEKQIEGIQQSLNDKINKIKEQISGFFAKMKDQVLSHSSSNTAVNNLFDTVQDFNDDIELLKSSVQRLINYLPEEDEEEVFIKEFEQKIIQQNIQAQYSEIQKIMEKSSQELEALLDLQRKNVQDLVLSSNILGKSNLKLFYSPSLKHSQIALVSKTLAKCTGATTNYRFALLEPELPKTKISKFAFKFKSFSTSNNWIAVGVCHKATIVSKNFGFHFSSVGHGGYMISSNGGTWSTHQVAYNNSVKAFSFGKNDVIIIEYDPMNKYVKFINQKKPEQTYKLETTHIDNDPIHACVLFYHLNDEVEYIHNYQSPSTSSTTSIINPQQQ